MPAKRELAYMIAAFIFSCVIRRRWISEVLHHRMVISRAANAAPRCLRIDRDTLAAMRRLAYTARLFLAIIAATMREQPRHRSTALICALLDTFAA